MMSLCRKMSRTPDAKLMAARNMQALGTLAAAECAVARTGSTVW